MVYGNIRPQEQPLHTIRHTLDVSNQPADPNKPTVLIVEDSPDVLALIVNQFRNSYNVLTATNGDLGMDTAVQHVPDIIITDVMMPVMDGYELCKQLKTHPATDHIPVIMLTAKVDRDSKISGLERGADAYINKPFDKEEVILTVQNLLDFQKKSHEKFKANAAENNIKEETDPFLLRVNAIILNNLADDKFTAETLSNKLSLSRSQTFRKIKALSGLNTQLYIRAVRLAEAKQMLQNTDKTVAEVAFCCGFTDPSYFTKVFSEHYHALPSQIKG
jgi:DNA-binding response OmpR family regulator